MMKVQPEYTKKSSLTHVFETFLPFFKMNRYVGSFSTKIVKKEGEIIIEKQKNDRIYLVAYYAIYSIALAYVSYATLQPHSDQQIAPNFLLIIQTITGVVCVLVNIVNCYLFRQWLLNCMQLLAEVDEAMFQLKIRVNYSTAQRYTYKILSVFLLSVTIRSLVMFGSSEQGIFVQIISFFTAFVKSMTKYILVVKLVPILVRFNKVNRAITNSCDRTDYNKLGEDLYKLCRLHFKLCNISRTLISTYTMQILSSLINGLINILFHSFYFYVVIVKRLNDANYFMIVTPLIWLIDEFLEIYLLVEACTNTADSANSTAVILHDLRNEIKNNEIDIHIQMFSLMMLHQKLEFSVLGFFLINHSLIYSILCAVITYLVIFIQFDQTDSRRSQNTLVTESFGNYTSLTSLSPF